jgi:hypothetical protein
MESSLDDKNMPEAAMYLMRAKASPKVYRNMIAPVVDQISSLLTLINDAARTLQEAYIDEDGYVPYLDDTESHPLDGKLSPPEMKEAVQVLEGACAQLCATLARPNHTLLNVSPNQLSFQLD